MQHSCRNDAQVGRLLFSCELTYFSRNPEGILAEHVRLPTGNLFQLYVAARYIENRNKIKYIR